MKLSEEAERINKKRRFTQMNEYDTFYRMHDKTISMFSKNIDLEKECARLEIEIHVFNEEIKKESVRLV